MANIKETAIDILNRCRMQTMTDNGLVATEEILDDRFIEHLWTKEFMVGSTKIRHEFFIVSVRSGIVRLSLSVSGPEGFSGAEDVLMAKFRHRYLSVNAIAAAMEAIIENY